MQVKGGGAVVRGGREKERFFNELNEQTGKIYLETINTNLAQV